MAACTTTYSNRARPSPGTGAASSVAKHNAELLAQQPLRRRGVRTPEIMLHAALRQHAPRQSAGSGSCAPDAHLLGGSCRAVLAGDGLWSAALQRHRRLLPRGVGEAAARSAARRESPAPPHRSAAFAARPHRWPRPPAWAWPRPNRPGRASTGMPETSAPVYAQFTPPPPPLR